MIKIGHIALALCIAAEAGALTSVKAEEVGFSMPSLIEEYRENETLKIPNISCIYYKERLLCDIHEHAWKNWGMDQPAGSIGTRFMIPAQGLAEPIRSSDEIPAGPILNYGGKIRLGPISCFSETIGLTCTNKSGGMMHLNRQFYILNKPVSSIPK